jgi:hypothetical protein
VPEQKAQRVELPGRGHESHQAGDEPPADHDPREPQPRPVSLGDERARDLEEEVAGEEDAGADPEDARIEAQRGVHRERGVGDVDAVDVRDRGDDEQRKHDVPVGLPAGARGDAFARRARVHAPEL